MKTEPISDLFLGGGRLIRPSRPEQTVAELDRQKVLSLFEQYGILLFRGFTITPADLTAITNRFTESYAVDAVRRQARFGEKVVRNVDYGNMGIPLHSEASFGAAWPEIVWFYCNLPPAKGGATTLCDGIKLWDQLSEKTQRLFLAQPLKYDVRIQMLESDPGGGTEPWPYKTPGVSGHINWDEGVINLIVLRYAVHPARLPKGNVLCFTNHLMSPHEPQIKSITMDGSPIPPEVISEIVSVSEKLIFEVAWQSEDLLMLDNVRFMHGRRGYDLSVARDIVQVQTSRASFAYGTTTRQHVKPTS